MDANWIEQYWKQGFVMVQNVFSLQEIEKLSTYFSEILALGKNLRETTKNGISEFRVIPINGKPTLKFAKWAASIHPGLNEFRTSQKLLDLVQTILGPNLRQITNQMHYKNPGDGVSFQMHQDCTFRKPDTAYRNLYSSFLQTAIAVDPSTVENGCLQLVPTSHLSRNPLLSGGYDGWAQSESANQEVLLKLPKAVNGIMDPGDVLIWNPFTIHGSQENKSSSSRRVYINGFAKTSDCDHGVLAVVEGKAVPLVYGTETKWDVVEER